MFVDNDIAASDPTKSRDHYDEMMTALAKGGFDVVVGQWLIVYIANPTSLVSS